MEIHCPESCPYLAAARSHPPAALQRQHERDLQALAPFAAGLSEGEYGLGLLLHASTASYRATAIPAVVDADLAEAAATLASTMETAQRGIIYEHATRSVPAQRLVEELRTAITRLEGERPGRLQREACAALRFLERCARGLDRSGQGPRALIEILDRLLGQQSLGAVPEAGRGQAAGEEVKGDTSPRIIVP